LLGRVASWALRARAVDHDTALLSGRVVLHLAVDHVHAGLGMGLDRAAAQLDPFRLRGRTFLAIAIRTARSDRAPMRPISRGAELRFSARYSRKSPNEPENRQDSPTAILLLVAHCDSEPRAAPSRPNRKRRSRGGGALVVVWLL
jgi:hypothetical protein